jgi:preprotein translocase subunit SecG
MLVLLTVLHILVCIFLIIVVLLQSGKAADLAGAFGGMGSQTAFGPRGSATLLSKATTGAAVVFMVTSLTLAIMASRRAGVGTTVLEEHKTPPVSTQKAPVSPVVPAAPGTQIPPPGAPKGPSVTLTPEGGGPSKTFPLDLSKMPRLNQQTGKIENPPQQQQQPQKQQPPKK